MNNIVYLLLPVVMAHADPDVVLENHRYPATYRADETTLQSVRVALYKYKGLIKLNTAALYVEMPEDRTRVLSGKVPLHLELTYFRELGKDVFVDTAVKYLEKNLSPAEQANIAESVETIHALYQPVQKDDRYSLTYIPGKGTTLSLNARALGLIPGEAFAKSYLTIWLGENSIGKSFTKALLTP